MTKNVSRKEVENLMKNTDNDLIKWACNISMRVKDLEEQVMELKAK